jgi:molybdate/tungstate transport system substrate-binding protein
MGYPGFIQNYKILSGNLIALCESGQIDYTFSYRAVAVQNHAKYIALPDNINLASRKFEDFYRQAQVKIRGSKPGEVVTINGEPILFALTVPKNFDDQALAASWVSFLLSDKGVDIMKSMGMNPIKPAITNDAGKLPESLNNYV